MRLNTTRTRRRRARGLLGAALTVTLAGCGIRATEVPTDFGPAPSRVPCATSAPDVAAQSQPGTPVQIFLVCGSQLVQVDRTAKPSGEGTAPDRVRVAQALLDELREPPTEAEDSAGFTTDVHDPLTVSGPGEGDQASALRLSKAPERMTAFELAQIICTFAHSMASDENGTVHLGGPTPESPLHHYECTEQLRARPGAGPAGTVD